LFSGDKSALSAGLAVQEGTADSPYAGAAGANSSLYSSKVPGFGPLVLVSGSKAATADPEFTLFFPERSPFRAYFKEAA
jgi:hypothetical protein